MRWSQNYQKKKVQPVVAWAAVWVVWVVWAATLLTAEDGGNMELVALGLDGSTVPILRVEGHDGSEITGPTVSPDRKFMTLSSQRGRKDSIGVTWLVEGPLPSV